MDKQEIYENLYKKFGIKQFYVFIEELSELQKEICKYLRSDNYNIHNISEEMADVEIILEQLKNIFQNEKEIINIKNDKILRTEERYFNG